MSDTRETALPKQSEPTDRTTALEAELRLLTTAGIVEVAVRNPNVSSYMDHWEGRALKAEAALAASPAPLTREKLRELLGAQEAALQAHREAMPQEHEILDVDQRLWDATQAAVWALEDAVRTPAERWPLLPDAASPAPTLAQLDALQYVGDADATGPFCAACYETNDFDFERGMLVAKHKPDCWLAAAIHARETAEARGPEGA